MRSEASRWDWLRSQGLGFVCGQLSVLLLGIGSLVIAATREGASADLQLDDLRPFFERPSAVHAWFYLLLGVLALYALNTALCTWDSARARLERGTKDLSSWAPTIIHVSWLVALLSHLVGGLGNRELEPVLVTSAWTAVDDLQLRLAALETDVTPSGKVKQTRATLEVRGRAGVETVVVGYNEPFSQGLGRELLLLSQAGNVPALASFSLGAARCEVVVPGVCTLGALSLEVLALQQAEHLGSRLVAVVHEGANAFPIAEGGTHVVSAGTLRFESVTSGQAVQLRHRHAPGNPVALCSAVLLALGLLMMGRRWLKPAAE